MIFIVIGTIMSQTELHALQHGHQTDTAANINPSPQKNYLSFCMVHNHLQFCIFYLQSEGCIDANRPETPTCPNHEAIT